MDQLEELSPNDPQFALRYNILSGMKSKEVLEEKVAKAKAAPYKSLEGLLDRYGEEIIALALNGKGVSLRELLVSFPDLSLGEILHAVWLLKQDQKVDFSHHIEEVDSLLERISVVPFRG